jgi:hypothetical protein
MPGRGRKYSNGALKLLNKMRETKAGWSPLSYRRLFSGFGFLSREGGNHTIYWDPVEKSNRVQVPRHDELLAYVAEQAVAAIEHKLDREEAEK